MIYDDDQCVQCGGIRVERSTLCANCLAAAVGEKLAKIDQLVKENKVLDEKCEKLRELCERLIDHITSEAVHNSALEEEIHRYWLKLRR